MVAKKDERYSVVSRQGRCEHRSRRGEVLVSTMGCYGRTVSAWGARCTRLVYMYNASLEHS